MKVTIAPNLGRPALLLFLVGLWTLDFKTSPAAPVRGWLNWRGPQQNGSSLEKNLPDKLNIKDALWVADFPGQSTPVIANGKLTSWATWATGRTCRKASPVLRRK